MWRNKRFSRVFGALAGLSAVLSGCVIGESDADIARKPQLIDTILDYSAQRCPMSAADREHVKLVLNRAPSQNLDSIITKKIAVYRDARLDHQKLPTELKSVSSQNPTVDAVLNQARDIIHRNNDGTYGTPVTAVFHNSVNPSLAIDSGHRSDSARIADTGIVPDLLAKLSENDSSAAHWSYRYGRTKWQPDGGRPGGVVFSAPFKLNPDLRQSLCGSIKGM